MRITLSGCILGLLGTPFILLVWSATYDKLAAQYINGSAPPITVGQFCAEFRGWVGMSRSGHTLRSVQCSGGGHEFTVHVRID